MWGGRGPAPGHSPGTMGELGPMLVGAGASHQIYVHMPLYIDIICDYYVYICIICIYISYVSMDIYMCVYIHLCVHIYIYIMWYAHMKYIHRWVLI